MTSILSVAKSWLPTILFVFINGHNINEHQQVHENHPVVIVSMDGFRHDYFERLDDLLPHSEINHFRQLASTGISAPSGILNIFATKTFVNHYTLVTGLFAESHGIVENVIYDEQLNRTVALHIPESAKYYRGAPIWANFGRQKSMNQVACFMWIGCNIPIDNFTLTRKVDFNQNATCDEQMQWLGSQLKDGVQLLLLYIDEPDAIGHKFGPDSKEMNDTLIKLNHCLGRLLGVVPSRNVNFFLVSDHGMSRFKRNVHIKRRDDLFWVRTSGYSQMMIDPKPNMLEKTMEHLNKYEGVKIYRKEDLPSRWHYRNSNRIRQVVVVADPNVRIIIVKKSTDPWIFKIVAGHGYDPDDPEMRPIFIGRGPDLVRNVTVDHRQLHSVDLYVLFCALLGIHPNPHNGSCTHVRSLLLPESRFLLDVVCPHEPSSATISSIVIPGLILISLLFALIMFFLHRCLLGNKRHVDVQNLACNPTLEHSFPLSNNRSINPTTQYYNYFKQSTPLLMTDLSDEDDEKDLLHRLSDR